MKPDARSKAWAIAHKMKTWRVEQWNQWSHKKTDLFWIADYVAMPQLNSEFYGSFPLMGIQCCGADKMSEHREALLHTPPKKTMLKRWLHNKLAYEIHGWRKGGPRGERKLWTLIRQAAILSPEGKVSFEAIEC